MDETTLARHIKVIGRGRHAGDLTRDDARTLFAAMLAGNVPELQLGAILIALRVKGESLDELAGFAVACEASYTHLGAPGGTVPVVIPAYNGARKLPNLVPLLALLLARDGIPVLVHGVMHERDRVTTCEILKELGIDAASSLSEAHRQLAASRMSFVPIGTLAPAIAALLALRRTLGVRNSAHTLVKMLQPVDGPAVRIVSVTHPEYLVRMREYFTRHDDAALLLRGAEGEAVAHPRREAAIDWAYNASVEPWKEDAAAGRAESVLPSRDADATARWIESVLAGDEPVPAAIAHQVECCRRAVEAIHARR
jgi:anthranilate phosphoribosyltransferase